MATLSIKYLDATYPSSNSAAAVAVDGDILSVEGTWSAADTTQVTLSDSVDWITDSASRHPGYGHTGAATHYRLRPTSGHTVTINATKTIVITGLDIRNGSTGVSDEVVRITTPHDPTVTFNDCLLGFASRNDQQDIVYAETNSLITLTFNQCVFYSAYRAVVDFFQPTSGSTANFNSCIAYDVGFSTGSTSRSGLLGHHYGGYIVGNVHNCYIHTNTGTPFTSDSVLTELHVTYSKCSAASFVQGSATLSTDTSNTVSIPIVASAPGSSSAYVTDITTNPYNLIPIDHANQALKDVHAVATSLSMTIPSTDIIGTSRPQNTNYEIGPFELIIGGGGGPVTLLEREYPRGVNRGILRGVI